MKSNLLSSSLKALRKKHGLTQVDLAMKSGVGLNFVRELEQGKATVRVDFRGEVLRHGSEGDVSPHLPVPICDRDIAKHRQVGHGNGGCGVRAA